MNKFLKTPIRNFLFHSILKCQERFKISNGVKILIISIAIFGAGFLFALPAKAIDSLIVEYSSDGGTSWSSLSAGSIFDETNFLPGENVTRLIKVTNNSGSTQRIAMEAINYAGFPNPDNVPGDDLSRALLIVIKQGTTDIFGGSAGSKTLFDFYKNGETYLSSLDNGLNIQYDIIISFPSDTGNDWQSKTTIKTTQFDILVGFEGTEGGLTLPPPGGSAGGGGLPSGLTIINETVQSATDVTVTIDWLTSYNATSQVIYGAAGENHTLDLTDTGDSPPKYGYEHTTPEYDTSPKKTGHSVTIFGLVPGTTYYFRVVSHASLAISLEHEFTTLGSKTEVSLGQGDMPQIAGETHALGAQTKKISSVFGTGASFSTGAAAPGAPGLAETQAGQPAEEKEMKLPEIEMTQEQEENSGNLFAGIGSFFGQNWWILLIIFVLALLTLFILWFFRRQGKKEEQKNNPQLPKQF